VRLGLIADIHANHAALAAILDALRRHDVDELVCLGDIVGYNAEPDACVALLRGATDRVILGNHDLAVLRGEVASGTNAIARAAVAWTRANISAESLAYLAGLPPELVVDDRYVAAHGSFVGDERHCGYVTGATLRANLDAIAAAPHWPKLALCGHTHMPVCGWLEGQIVHSSPLLRTVRWPAGARVVLINPGSVGQPRDGDTRAAAAIVDLERREVTPVRCDYDVERTIAAIHRAGLPEALADRLRLGW
jgi:predicted phosphodiesterase